MPLFRRRRKNRLSSSVSPRLVLTACLPAGVARWKLLNICTESGWLGLYPTLRIPRLTFTWNTTDCPISKSGPRNSQLLQMEHIYSAALTLRYRTFYKLTREMSL
jgi:hypothetical protein